MSTSLLPLLRCPICRAAFASPWMCENGHSFTSRDGVANLLPDQRAAREQGATFGREWDFFQHDVDRTWGQTVEERSDDFQRHVGLSGSGLAGKLVLDAGCGNAMLSNAITELGCDVVACDVSPSVYSAARHFAANPRLRFVRCDLGRHPFRPATFDVVYCAGVLHHTVDTKASFLSVAEAVKPGGVFFVWLYHVLPGRQQQVKAALRSGIARSPKPIRNSVATLMAAQKTVRGRGEGSWRETLVDTHDYWTPRYRYTHTQEELLGWFRELGYTGPQVTEAAVEGFGVRAIAPS